MGIVDKIKKAVFGEPPPPANPFQAAFEAWAKALGKRPIIRGNYQIVVGKKQKNPVPVVFREGVPRDEFKGRLSSFWITKAGKVAVCLRHYHRITPGERRLVPDSLLKIAEASPLAFKGLAGEFQYRTLRGEGIMELEVCRGGKWYPLSPPPIPDWESAEIVLRLREKYEALQAARLNRRRIERGLAPLAD